MVAWPRPTRRSSRTLRVMDLHSDVTGLLSGLRKGDEEAANQLFHVLYEELHAVAHRQLSWQQPGQTMSTTELVHEAYIKLVGPRQASWEDRKHFFAASARAMRHILVDHARKRLALKRVAARAESRWTLPSSEGKDVWRNSLLSTTPSPS